MKQVPENCTAVCPGADPGASLTQQPLKLLDGEHRVVLRAVVEVVRHLGHVPRHGPAQRDPHRLAGRRPDRSRPQRAGHGQQRHAESRGQHVVGSDHGGEFNPHTLAAAFLLLLSVCGQLEEAGGAASSSSGPPLCPHLSSASSSTSHPPPHYKRDSF